MLVSIALTAATVHGVHLHKTSRRNGQRPETKRSPDKYNINIRLVKLKEKKQIQKWLAT